MSQDMPSGDLAGPITSPETPRDIGGAHLVAELRQAQARADRAEREVARTRQSAAYVVGDLMVRAAKEPRRLLTLPRDLWRVWRMRRHRRPAPRPTAASPARTREAVDRDATRLLVPRIASVPPGRGLSIAGALSHETVRAWSPYAAVSAALPHEAAALVEAIDPDIVVIDTSAALPGQAWSHLGDPAAVDRLLAAGALVDAAHALGRPVVLLRMTPPSHTAFLDGLAERCDLVVDGPGSSRRHPWHPGIDPLDRVPAASAPSLLYAVREGRDDGDTRAIAAAAMRTTRIDPSLPEDVAWHRALSAATGVLVETTRPGLMGAASPGLCALASGRRLFAPGDHDLADMLEAWPAAGDALLAHADLTALVAAASRGPDALSPGEHHAAFAAILLDASAPVQLTGLCQRLGLPARPRACWDIALVADADIDPARVIAQAWRPREVITDSTIGDRARTALHDAGIEVIVAEGGEDLDIARLGVASPYVASHVDVRDPHDLLNLLAASLLGQGPLIHPNDARLVCMR